MSASLGVEVVGGRLEQLAGELLAAFFFEDERPLRGPAGRVDWRLCGLASRHLLRGRPAGRAGEALLAPTAGRLAAPRVLLAGLGRRAGFGADALADAARAAAGRALALRVGRLALAPPSEAQAGVGPGKAAVALVAGVAEALARHPAALHLRLWAPEEALAAVRRGAAEAVGSGALAVPARLVRAAPGPVRSGGPSGAARMADASRPSPVRSGGP